MSCKSCAGLNFSDDKNVCSTHQCNVSKDPFTYVSGDGLKGCFAKPSGTNPDNCCDLSKCPPPPSPPVSPGDDESSTSSDGFPWGWIILLLVFLAIGAVVVISTYRGDRQYREFMKHRRLSDY
jgi:hypothetical protein